MNFCVPLVILVQVGDQLIRVNGYAVDDAVHRELSQYIACQDRLTLKVRGKQNKTMRLDYEI